MMAQGNPFYVQPGGDMTQGLAGLGQVLAENRAKKEEQAAEQKQKERIAAAQQAARQALQSGDPMMVAETAIQYPEVGEMLNNQAGLIDDAKKQDAKQFSMELLAAGPDERAGVYQRRIKQLSDQGRDPSHTMQSYRDYLADPDREIKGVETMFAASNPDAYKSMKQATTVKPAETREIKRGERIITQQWDPSTGSWTDIADASRFNPNAGTTVNNNVSTGSDKFTEEVAKADADRFAEFATVGQNAGRKLIQLNRMDKLLDSSGSGIGTNLKAIAGNFGIKTDGIDEIQAAQALISQMVPEQRPEGSGEMSDEDLELFKQSLPRLINTPGGNRRIIDTLKSINQYDQRIGQIANRAMSGEISRNEARNQMMQVPNPLENFQVGGGGNNGGNDSVPEGVEPDVWEVMTDKERDLWRN